MNDEHCGDDAELYALGLLAGDRAAQIEQHCSACGPCRERVVAAEMAAAALAATLPAAAAVPIASRTPRVWPMLAAAAALLFACTTGLESLALGRATAQTTSTDHVLAVLAASHFSHTTLTSPPGTDVKMLYARDGSWLYVIANGLRSPLRVAVDGAGAARDLGELRPGAPATLFATGTGKLSGVRLVDGDRVVARGAPQY